MGVGSGIFLPCCRESASSFAVLLNHQQAFLIGRMNTYHNIILCRYVPWYIHTWYFILWLLFTCFFGFVLGLFVGRSLTFFLFGRCGVDLFPLVSWYDVLTDSDGGLVWVQLQQCEEGKHNSTASITIDIIIITGSE